MGSRLCVIVPAKDDGRVIARTLRSILAARVLPSDVYVIDDGSSDGTGEIAKGYGVNVIRNQRNLGKANAIARGVREFSLVDRYNIISLMDADTTVSQNYYAEVRKGFEDPEVALVCGRAKSVPYNWLTAYRCFGYFVTHFVYRGAQSNMGVVNVAPGCASSYRSDVFRQLDWNRDTLVEDMDVTVQVHRKGLGKIVYCPKARVFTQDPRTLRDYVKQMYRWYTGTWQVGIKYRILPGWTWLDCEYKLLMGEGLVFASMMALTPLWLALWPLRTLAAMGCDLLVTTAIAALCGLMDKRFDVVAASPAYPLMRFVDCGVLLYSFWKTVVQRQNVQKWFAVQRY